MLVHGAGGGLGSIAVQYARALGARGIPTTLLIDRSGKERGRLEGAADWASDDSVGVIRKLIGQSAQSPGGAFRGSNA